MHKVRTNYAAPQACHRGSAQRPPQPVLRDPPEIVLYAVHERHRDLVPELTLIRLGLRDVAFLPAYAEVSSDPADDLARFLAQVAAGAGEERDPRLTHRSGPFPLPVALGARVPLGGLPAVIAVTAPVALVAVGPGTG